MAETQPHGVAHRTVTVSTSVGNKSHNDVNSGSNRSSRRNTRRMVVVRSYSFPQEEDEQIMGKAQSARVLPSTTTTTGATFNRKRQRACDRSNKQLAVLGTTNRCDRGSRKLRGRRETSSEESEMEGRMREDCERGKVRSE